MSVFHGVPSNPTTTTPPALPDRVNGALLGLALGDALGVALGLEDALAVDVGVTEGVAVAVGTSPEAHHSRPME